MEWIFFLGLFLPIILYAEIHFRFPLLPSRLYQAEPEIVLDIPYRTEAGKKIPVFLIVKDAHRFPITLMRLVLDIRALSTQNNYSHTENLEIQVRDKFYSQIFYLDIDQFTEKGDFEIVARVDYLTPAGKKKSIIQDNYRFLPHPPFKIYISEEKMPIGENWYWGDLHNHSNYTDDQVEFGAPIEFLASAAEAMGLQFLAVTDHSYDLDDKSNNYLLNDPNLEKWSSFQNELKSIQISYPNVILIPGEEISTGNHKNQNIHCLFLNDPEFFPGNGDSAEILWKNQPTLPLTKILQDKSENALAIAAHPLEAPPFSQRVILRRGIWGAEDLTHPTLDALQVLNGENEDLLKKGLNLWSNLLLQGRRIGIVAGSDSHGNFNCFRQVSIPFLKMAFSRNHLFGKVKTGVFLKKFTLEGLIQGIRNHQTLISNGPFAALEIRGEKLIRIGDTFRKRFGSTASYIGFKQQ